MWAFFLISASFILHLNLELADVIIEDAFVWILQSEKSFLSTIAKQEKYPWQDMPLKKLPL